MQNSRDFEAVRNDITKILRKPEYDDGSIGPVLVRLAWHASGTYDKETDTGGSNGAGMRYEEEGGDPANAGLQHARVFLEAIKEKHSWITYSDLWTLAGVVAIEQMGGPKIPWKPGRSDFANDSLLPPRGRLPDAAQGSDHLRWVFYKMNMNDQEIVALSGAHSLGRCHSDRSGFEGPWVPNPTRFSNQYYKLLLKLKWQPKNWKGRQGMPFQWAAKAPGVGDDGEELMMLPTDMALIQDPSFRPWVEKYATDKDLFFDHFTKAFAKLIELGVYRNEQGIATFDHLNNSGGMAEYKSAPQKSMRPGASDSGKDGVQISRARL
ncbi:class II peroxidase [Tilletiaria anomala UBC 951]|uniref:Peroxidase n=1 Tax=Tilletiaria anomala (strain ATCC 24038 / CBS 436.72 / UBC 951) TaxID=1037660 RepID=A0A066WNU7_TILAU|nr:class II peroxidase [Tilletiaria anomala UBC 951]KDN52679.1 class II peroxidase [Tilletiaria anomala UBC 951]